MEIETIIFEDCLSLINKFAECKNPNFNTFCEKWHEAKFPCIYATQTSVIEVIQTTKAILYLAKRIVCANDETGQQAMEVNKNRQIYRRFAGMYLMYAVYLKQPTYQYAKVLMSYETWKDLLTFIESLPTIRSADEVRYIFWNLYKEDAFRFTGHDYDLGLENLADYDRLYDIHNGNKHFDVVREKLKQKLMVVIETVEDLPHMVSLEEQYNNSKLLLTANKSSKPLPPTEIFKDIDVAMQKIHKILDQKDDDSVTPNDALSASEKRKELKRKAAGYITNDEDSPEEYQYPETECVRRYLCSRKLMTQELPESITAYLKDNSTDDED